MKDQWLGGGSGQTACPGAAVFCRVAADGLGQGDACGIWPAACPAGAAGAVAGAAATLGLGFGLIADLGIESVSS